MCPKSSENISSLQFKMYPYKMAEYFFVKNEYKLTRIDFKDILYIEGMGDYQCIHTSSKKIMTLQTFDKLSEKLPQTCFIRIHKSFIISLEKISTIEKNQILIGGTELPIGQKYKEDFFRQLEDLSLI